MDEQNLIVDKICGIAREKQCRPTDIVRRAPPTKRCAADYLVRKAGLCPDVRRQVGRDEARSNTIHADPLIAELTRQHPHQTSESGFC